MQLNVLMKFRSDNQMIVNLLKMKGIFFGNVKKCVVTFNGQSVEQVNAISIQVMSFSKSNEKKLWLSKWIDQQGHICCLRKTKQDKNVPPQVMFSNY